MKKEDVVKFNNALFKFSPDESSEDAKSLIEELKKTVYYAESALSDLAVKHQIHVCLDGPYGAGRWVILEDEDDGWNEYQAGDWQASAESC